MLKLIDDFLQGAIYTLGSMALGLIFLFLFVSIMMFFAKRR